MYKEKFRYTDILKDTNEDTGVRVYRVGDSSLPSVTTILSATKPAEDLKALKQWRKNVGADEANRITTEATTIGTKIHDNLEQYLIEGQAPKGPVLVRLMTEQIIKQGLTHLDEWWGAECPLYMTGLYAGTADLVGVYRSRPAIIDFKNSRKKKKLEWMNDYRCQLAAYALAHNEMYGTDIKTGVILMVTRKCQFEEFLIEGEVFDESVRMWLQRLDAYYDK